LATPTTDSATADWSTRSAIEDIVSAEPQVTGGELLDQAWGLLRRINARQRRDCFWAIDHENWLKLRRYTQPWLRDVLQPPAAPPQDWLLFGKSVTITEDVTGLTLVVPDPTCAHCSPPHPQTQAINDEFGWDDAHVVTFADSKG
jgi:hypothetical protein